MKQIEHEKYLKHTLCSFITTCMLLFCGLTFAQPANDDICSATVLPTDGTCLTAQTNVDATSDYYGGCIQPEISRFGTVLLSQHQMII